MEIYTGAEALAWLLTIIETGKLNGIDPQAYLTDVFDRIHDYMINHLDEFCSGSGRRTPPALTVNLHKMRYQWRGYP